ncbi:hypothetical protein [Burkholderia alba]|uniref:hypothetical protein n=1 Tax=Burkholderia alba TaxID=2683677 RepID=UPI002B059BCF|nr:hypothetical protein [Burkholderia alba]
MSMLGLIIQLVSGATGGNVAASLLEKYSLGPVGNTLAGIIGGGIGGELIKIALGGAAQTADGFDRGMLFGSIGGGGASGALVVLATGFARARYAGNAS